MSLLTGSVGLWKSEESSRKEHSLAWNMCSRLGYDANGVG